MKQIVYAANCAAASQWNGRLQFTMQNVILKIAPPYDAEQIDKIKIGFEKLLGHTIDLKIEEDENLIGGFCAFADGKVYDASLKTRLMEMRRNLSD